MLRRIITLVVVLAVFVAVVVFWDLNRGPIDVNLAFTTVSTQIPTAFVSAFVIGWLFGLFCAAFFVLRTLNERRRLKKSLRLAEAEISSLRSLPLQDAGD